MVGRLEYLAMDIDPLDLIDSALLLTLVLFIMYTCDTARFS